LPAKAASTIRTIAIVSSVATPPGNRSICSVAMNSPMLNSRVSPGRNGNSSPHSTNSTARLIQKSASPK
jgi:hypothetical protein